MARPTRFSTRALALALALAGCDDGDGMPGVMPDAMTDAMADTIPDTIPDAMPDAMLDPPDPCRLPAPPPVEPALAAALDAALAAGFDAAAAPGAAATVVLPDGRAWIGAIGRDDNRAPDPLPPHARFRVASVTKTFTAAAVLQHVEAGDWTLDDPIDDWVEGFDLGPGVTLGRLLDHTAGVFNYSDDASFLLRRTEPQTPEQVIAFALTHDPPFAPGEGYRYSNTGYFLLGLALEAIERRPFPEILRARLIEPHGLAHTWMQQSEPPPGGCDIGQGHVGFGTGVTEGFTMTWAWAAGGLAAPVGDLCLWARALFGGAVLDPATLEAMIAPTPQSLAAEEPYGLGVYVTERAGRAVVGHTGSIMGFRGEVFFDRAAGVCVAVETNDFTARPEAIAEALWSALP